MVNSGAMTLNTNVANDTGASLSLTNETLITALSCNYTGECTLVEIGFEVSPDGGNCWVKLDKYLSIGKTSTFSVCCDQIRPFISTPEMDAATIDVFIVAK